MVRKPLNMLDCVDISQVAVIFFFSVNWMPLCSRLLRDQKFQGLCEDLKCESLACNAVV